MTLNYRKLAWNILKQKNDWNWSDMDHSIIMIHFVIVTVDRFYENFIVIGNIIVISLSTFAFVENARHYDD